MLGKLIPIQLALSPPSYIEPPFKQRGAFGSLTVYQDLYTIIYQGGQSRPGYVLTITENARPKPTSVDVGTGSDTRTSGVKP
jgi:hypothetical protein